MSIIEEPGHYDSDQNESDVMEQDDSNDNEDDDYFKKAVELYKNKKYDEAETILKLVTAIKPNHFEAKRLYKYLSEKMYIKEQKVSDQKMESLISKETTSESKQNDEVKIKSIDENDDDNVKDQCQIEVL